MKKLISIICLCIFTMMGCTTSPEKSTDPDLTYTNPVFKPVLADPSIIKAENGWYYAYGTQDFWGYDEGVKYGPITKSRNLVDWEYVGDVFEYTPVWHGGGVWAPDIQYFNNKYYLYYSMSTWGDSNPAIGLATADDPEGPWTDHGKFFDSKEIGVANSIDSFVIQDEKTEKRYMFWGSFHGIYATEITADGHKYKSGTKVHIAGNAFEAPYIIKRNEYYYLFASTGSCCEGINSTYQVKVGRSKNLLGPYLDKEGNDLINSHGSLVLGKSGQFTGNGHNAVIQDDAGIDWIVYHGVDVKNGHMDDGITTRRPLFIDPLLWDNNGWPYVKDFMPSNGNVKKPVIKKAQAVVSINWQEDTVQFVSDGVYSRVKKLSDGRLILVYSEGVDAVYRISADNGNSWGKQQTVARGGTAYNNTNAEFIELSNGDWLFGYNARPLKENGKETFQIKTVRSTDQGKSWVDDTLVYEGKNTFTDGVWEPVFLELPNGELQLYFADESKYLTNADQQISLMRSVDNGLTWSATENVSYRAGSRDGMPVPILLNDQSSIVFSMEDNGIDGDFKPVTIRTDFSDNWQSGSVNATSEKRNRALVKHLDKDIYAGAPYLAQLTSGETLLSFQSSESRGKRGLEESIMRVYIGDKQAENFGSKSTPFTKSLIKANGNALWSSITVLDDSTVIATSSINTGDSKPNGIYIVKGTVTRH